MWQDNESIYIMLKKKIYIYSIRQNSVLQPMLSAACN